MNSNSRYSLGFFELDSRISREEAVGFCAKNAKIKKIPHRDSKQ